MSDENAPLRRAFFFRGAMRRLITDAIQARWLRLDKSEPHRRRCRMPEENRAMLEARHKAEERQANSPPGMQARAAELRARAGEMEDTNDRDAMLRLAAGYVRRAEDAARRMKIKAPARRFNVGAND